MLKNNWTARGPLGRTESQKFFQGVPPPAREAADIKFLQNADKITIYIMPSRFVNYGTRTNGGVRAAKLL
jgi:hypothetical protein